jgi:macrocin-O-methyltransferase TylF-like protien
MAVRKRNWNDFLSRLFRLLLEPRRLRKAVVVRLRTLPFRLGASSVWPGTYIGYVPDRYSENYDRYVARGGVNRLFSAHKFYRGNEANNRGDLSRFYFLCLAIDQVVKEGLRGDVAELGVYKGNTAFLLAQAARHLGSTAYLLDTFEGFSKADLTGIDKHVHPLLFEDTRLQAVRSLVGNENVRFIQGHFPGSAAQIPDGVGFILVHIDCDLYAPFRGALQYFYPRMVSGGFLIMHDYASLSWDGAEKAVDEFFADKPEKVIPIPDKSGTVVIRKV